MASPTGPIDTLPQSSSAPGTTSSAGSTPRLSTSQVIPRSNRPVSEGLLNDKWDHALSSLLIRSSLGAGFGIVFSVLLFKRRAWPAWVGLGFGAGRAWEEADG
ncbi:hypothetical protein MMC10_009357 [Thelotrema lepadinum]|nr:hypothetical protein [Thelotrema lepadinum]